MLMHLCVTRRQEGTDCSQKTVITEPNCYFVRDGDYTLVPGGKYSLKWTPPSEGGYSFKIMMYEVDTVGDDDCGRISSEAFDASSGSASFVLPFWEDLEEGCASGDGVAGG